MDTSGGTFYLAIRRTSQTAWFLSLLEAALPRQRRDGRGRQPGHAGGDLPGAEQKLFILDADHRKKSNDLFDPTVWSTPTPSSATSNRSTACAARTRITHRPHAGLSRISAASDYFSRFIADSAASRRSSPSPSASAASRMGSPTRRSSPAWRTGRLLRVDNPLEPTASASPAPWAWLRKYQEGAGFTSTERPAGTSTSPPGPVSSPTPAELSAPVAKWNIHPKAHEAHHGTSLTPSSRSRPTARYQPYDLVGAVKRGDRDGTRPSGSRCSRSP